MSIAQKVIRLVVPPNVYASVYLASIGYLAASPLKPSTAFSFGLLELFSVLQTTANVNQWSMAQSFSTLAKVKSLSFFSLSID